MKGLLCIHLEHAEHVSWKTENVPFYECLSSLEATKIFQIPEKQSWGNSHFWNCKKVLFWGYYFQKRTLAGLL
jgi:hypothetical protein